jgi:DNA-binding CsgD family transcriptional regulator
LDGKTIGVIADILKVKESSAKYHAQQVQAKFGCPLHLAAVIALRLKLLD